MLDLESPPLRNELKRNSLIYFLGGAVSSGGNVLLAPIYAKYMNPSEYGIVASVAMLSALMAAVLSFGFGGAVTRYYFELRDDDDEWKGMLGAVTAFTIVIGVLVALLFSTFLEHVWTALFPAVEFRPYAQLGVWIGFVGALPTIPLAVLQAEGDALRYRSLTTASFALVVCFTIVFLVAMREGALGVLSAQLWAGLLMAIYYLYSIWKGTSLRLSLSHLGKALQFGLPITVYAILGITTEISSKYLVQYLAGLADLGVYSLALMYASILSLVASAINMAWVPIFYEQGLTPRGVGLYRTFALHYLAAMCVLGLILSLFAEDVITAFVSATYHEAHEIAPLLVLANFLGPVIWTVTVNPIFLAKKTSVLPWLTGVSSIFAIISSLYLIPRFGIAGASLALLIGNVVLVSSSFRVSQRLYPVAYEFKKMGLVFMLALIVWAIGRELESGTLESILIKAALCSVFVAFVFATKTVSMSTYLGIRRLKG
jgi:O-antigen/teichoic acid export membrane protein